MAEGESERMTQDDPDRDIIEKISELENIQ